MDGLPSGRPLARLFLLSVGAFTVALTVFYLGTFFHRSSAYSLLDDGILANVITALTGVITFARAALVRDRRAAFVLLGLTSVTYCVGNCTYVFYVQYQDPVPFPSLADAGYLSTAPLIIAAVLTLAWPHVRSQPLSARLDASLGALSSAASGSIVLLAPLIGALEGSTVVRIVAGAYPVCDVIQLALIIGILTLRGARFDWTWFWLTLGIVTFTAADIIFLYNENNFTAASPTNSLYVVGLTLMAITALLPVRPERRRALHGAQDVLLRNVFSLGGVMILVYGSVKQDRLPLYAVVLAIATLLTAAKRAALGFSALRLLALSQRQAKTDELTQLFNRRHFDEQMQRTLAGRKFDANLAVLILDLNGFKAINDNFGHHAGDEAMYDAKVNRLGVVVFDGERHQSVRKSLNVNTAILLRESRNDRRTDPGSAPDRVVRPRDLAA